MLHVIHVNEDKPSDILLLLPNPLPGATCNEITEQITHSK